MKKETFRILLTEKCNANCSNCFNADYRKNKDMYIEDFFMLCDFLSVNNIKHLKIMGGEPTVHPYFLDAVEYAQKKFSKILSLRQNSLGSVPHRASRHENKRTPFQSRRQMHGLRKMRGKLSRRQYRHVGGQA